MKFMIISLHKLYFDTHNGGLEHKKSDIDERIDHDRPVSFLALANRGLSITGGVAELGYSEVELKNSANSRRFKLS